MPTIRPADIRTLATQLSQDGKLNRADVDQLIDKALEGGAVPADVKAELEQVLVDFGDQVDSGATERRLRAFLDISDPGLQALARSLEKDDGVLSADDADKLLSLVNDDGSVNDTEKFSLAAVLVGTKMSTEARAKLADAAGLENVRAESSPDLAIPDNDKTGVKDTIAIDAEGQIAGITIDVDLTHTWKGDLQLKLIAPDGTEVMLHNRGGRSADDIKGTFPTTLTPDGDLDALMGADAKGDWSLHLVDAAGYDTGTLHNWALDIQTTKTGTPEVGGFAMDVTGNFRPVFLSSEGWFVENEGDAAPNGNLAMGEGLYRMAELVDDKKANPFADRAVPLQTKALAFSKLQEALAMVPPDGARPDDMDATQALQLRSCAATVLLSMIEATGNSGADLELKREMFMAYTSALKNETHPTLKDSMIFQLDYMKSGLPTDLRVKAEDLAEAIAPTSPPYDEWFKDGNTTLNVAWTTGLGEDFFGGTMELLEKRGFSPVDPDDTTPPAVFTKEIERDGKTIDVNLTLYKNNNHKIFNEMDNEDVHIVGYDGHSDIGRNIPASLKRGPDEAGKKLVFYGLCAGKDNLHNVREKYPDSQVITTFNSSYFNTKDVDGRKVMTRSENFNVLMELIDGAASRSDWNGINENIRRKAVLFPWSHPMPGGTNYISPVHTQIRRKVLDSDHDGQADIMDKLVDFSLYRVDTDTAREFQPLDAGRPARTLDGTVTHLAAQALNTATGYNTETKAYKKQNIIGGGYFEPKDGDPIVKFEESDIDGASVLTMTVNANYAHMSVEALRAVAHFAFIQEMGDERNLNPVDKKLMGLIFAAFSVNYDEAHWFRDDKIWSGLLESQGLPADIPYDSIRKILDDEHHDYSGAKRHISEWKPSIPQSALDALAAMTDVS